MTVNELIAELQVLSAQGHGELDICVEVTDPSGTEIEQADAPVLAKYHKHYKDVVKRDCILIA